MPWTDRLADLLTTYPGLKCELAICPYPRSSPIPSPVSRP